MNFQYNIHPILVHFPIALLTLYSVLEIISIGRLRNKSEMFWIKFVLVTLGGIGLLAARQAGSIAKSLIADKGLYILIGRHETFANLTTAIFGVIAAGYVFMMFKQTNWKITTVLQPLWQIVYWVGDLITSNYLVKLLALAGLVSLTITGALGGSIVYGAANDPFTNFVYHLFFQ